MGLPSSLLPRRFCHDEEIPVLLLCSHRNLVAQSCNQLCIWGWDRVGQGGEVNVLRTVVLHRPWGAFARADTHQLMLYMYCRERGVNGTLGSTPRESGYGKADTADVKRWQQQHPWQVRLPFPSHMLLYHPHPHLSKATYPCLPSPSASPSLSLFPSSSAGTP